MATSEIVFVFLTIIFWILVTGYWIVSARKIGQGHRGNEIFSFIKLIGSALIIYLPLLTGTFLATKLYTTHFLTGVIGSALCLSGILIMVWAREHLGKNWSGNVILQQGHSISKDGPYKYIRHPIYSGGLLAMLVSAVVVGQIFGFVWVLFCIFGLNVKINKEEDLLTGQFPDEYPQYKKYTKKLVPFIW